MIVCDHLGVTSLVPTFFSKGKGKVLGSRLRGTEVIRTYGVRMRTATEIGKKDDMM